MSNLYQYGPFQNDEIREDVAAYRNPAPQAPVDHEAFRSEIVDYFTRRQARLKIVKTTTTPRGQTIDWIPIESQTPKGLLATPPPLSDVTASTPGTSINFWRPQDSFVPGTPDSDIL
jgi:hypothetical protein